jgi:hypothetical protein
MMCFILALASVFPFFLYSCICLVWASGGSVFSISPLEIPHYFINSVRCYIGIKASERAIHADEPGVFCSKSHYGS